MAGFLTSLTDRGAAPALAATLSFNEARLRVVSENLANIHTPGYRARRLDVKGFQRALREALDEKQNDPGRPFNVRSGNQVRTRPDGRLQITPDDEPVENVLFHDGTNLSLERLMADVTQTQMTHDVAVTLLTDRFNRLKQAIRGTIA